MARCDVRRILFFFAVLCVSVFLAVDFLISPVYFGAVVPPSSSSSSSPSSHFTASRPRRTTPLALSQPAKSPEPVAQPQMEEAIELEESASSVAPVSVALTTIPAIATTTTSIIKDVTTTTTTIPPHHHHLSGTVSEEWIPLMDKLASSNNISSFINSNRSLDSFSFPRSPLDVRTMAAITKYGGYNRSVPQGRTWIVVRRADAMRWWQSRFGPVIGLERFRSPFIDWYLHNRTTTNKQEQRRRHRRRRSRRVWSCGLGHVRPVDFTVPIRNQTFHEPRSFFKYWNYLRDPRDVQPMGSGWGDEFDPTALALANLTSIQSKLLGFYGGDVPPMRNWVEYIAPPCYRVPVAVTVPGTNETSVRPGETVSWRSKHIGLRSMSRNQLHATCVDDVFLLDGRAPSFAHAMSRRCKNITEMRLRKLFIAGIGHSHTRFLFGMLCMLSNHSWCGDFSKFHFHMPLYPVQAGDWWERQVIPRVVEGSSSNISSNHSSDNSTTAAESNDAEEEEETNMHFKLFYSASWYDSRVGFIRFVKYCIRLQDQEMLEVKLNITAPNIEINHSADLGFGDDGNDPEQAASAKRQQQKQWDDQLRSWFWRVRPLMQQVPTHIVVSRGEWDIHYLSPNLYNMAVQFGEFMSLLHELLPDAVIILQLPQRHIQLPPMINNTLGPYRLVCASDARVEALRQANLCAAHIAFHSARNSTSLREKFVLFDSDVIARTTIGLSFVDRSGHHYTDVPLELLAMELRHIASNDAVQRWYSMKGWKSHIAHAGNLCHKLNSTAPYAPEWMDQVQQGERQVPKATVKSAQLIDANVKLLTYSQFLGFPPLPGRREEICTCHRDVVMNKTFCAEFNDRLAPREFKFFRELERNRELRQQLLLQHQKLQAMHAASSSLSPVGGGSASEDLNKTAQREFELLENATIDS